MKKSRLLLQATVIVLTVACLLGGIIYFIKSKNVDESANISKLDTTFIIDSKEYEEDKDKEVALVVGLDSYDNEASEGYMNNKLADFIYLLILDKDTKKITPIQINRDSMVNYNTLGVMGDIIGKEYGQIALSHSYGDGGLTSLCNVKDAVSELFYGLHIDYYASLTMDAIPVINDEVCGVEVDVKDDFSNVDPSIVMGEKITLKGNQALTYVRARSGMEDSTNLSRMTRQREYLDGLYSKFIEKAKADDNFTPNLLEKVSDKMVSSANTSDLQQLLNLARNFKLNDTLVLQGEAIKGKEYIEFYIDKDSLNEISIKTFLKEIN